MRARRRRRSGRDGTDGLTAAEGDDGGVGWDDAPPIQVGVGTEPNVMSAEAPSSDRTMRYNRESNKTDAAGINWDNAAGSIRVWGGSVMTIRCGVHFHRASGPPPPPK